ncbi:hypothetical protein [Gaiella sp.]|jgi:hypothetical protein|uniref:hypothetical protein n=1 Tax=Gaiella sp. TaxID=2663207 RepID=UPI002E2EF60F|nr:hypothetical protein [Gaiella sp.]HEX5584957.1 hypothetical protein [Gaiella sp.]
MTSSAPRLLAAGALAAFLACLGLAVALGLDDGESTAGPPPARAGTVAAKKPAKKAKPRPAQAPFVRLVAVGAFDPEGDGHERDEEARFAVDGRADTSWRTEHYSSFFKSGVGLVLDMRRKARVERVLVDSPSRGSSAQIKLGDSPQGPFRVVSATRPLTTHTSFPVPRQAGRYVLVWIVGMPDDSATEVAEVRVRART